MTNKKALQLIRKAGFATDVMPDGHVRIRDEDGRVIGKMRQTGAAHMSLVKWITAGFPKRPLQADRYMKLLLPFDSEEELLFWTDDEDIPTAE